jgi:hypothetical protein
MNAKIDNLGFFPFLVAAGAVLHLTPSALCPAVQGALGRTNEALFFSMTSARSHGFPRWRGSTQRARPGVQRRRGL